MEPNAPAPRPQPSSETPKPDRRHDLDWLRVIAILLLLFYHCGMAFVAEWGWHIKNKETSQIFQEWMFFLSRWRMALLFFISGVGTYFVIRNSTGAEYLRRRFLRLFVPLVFGILVIVPPQIYLERLAQGKTYSTYLAFYPSIFELKPYPEGNLSWHHLWFIAYLFLYSILATPVFLWLKTGTGRAFTARVAGAMTGWGLALFALPQAVVYAGLIVKFPGPQNIVNDWAMFSYYLLFFLYGYVFSLERRFSEIIERHRRMMLKLAFVCLVLVDYIRWNDLEPPFAYSVPQTLYRTLLAFNAWFWMLALLGYARRYLHFHSPLLAYSNEGIYPFYILHQTVIVILAFYVVQTSDTILMKFGFLCAASFLVTVAIYHFGIRPYNSLRFLFGMKPRREP